MTATTEARPSEDLEEIAARLDETMASVNALEPSARQAVNAVLSSLDGLHRKALVTIVRRLREDDRGRELLYELVDDPTVRMVLSMHEIIRPDPVTSAGRVLEQVRPGLQSHGGDVQLDRIEGTTAYVRLVGACNGCSMASVTMRDQVTEALLAGVPGLTGVEVVPNDPSPTVIPLDSITVRATDPQETRRELAEAGWIPSLSAASVPTGEVVAASLPDVEVILIGLTGGVAAYVNKCAHQGLPLDNAMIDINEGTLTCPWHGLCYDATSGECTSLPGAQLEQVPVRVVDQTIWIRPGGAS